MAQPWRVSPTILPKVYVNAARNYEDQEHRQQVAERSRVLERMRGVGVEEASPIGAQLLDGFLRSYRSLRDDLLGAFNRGHFGVRFEVLDHTLRDVEQASHDRDRKQHVYSRASDVHPEVPDGFLFLPGETADKRDRNRDARGCRSEVLHRQGGHLHEIAHGRFAGVCLPVGVRHEAGRGIERQVRRDVARVEVLRIKGQKPLCTLQEVGQQETEEAEA